MFDSIFDRAGESLVKVVRGAIQEKSRLQNRYVCTEHLLLAITRDSTNLAARALATMKIDADSAQKEVDKQLKEKSGSEPFREEQPEFKIQRGASIDFTPTADESQMPDFSDPAMQALARAEDYSVFFGQETIEPEHLLLGLMDLQQAGACKVFEELSANLTFLRRQVMKLMAREFSVSKEVPSLRIALTLGLRRLVEKYQDAVNHLNILAMRSRQRITNLPTRKDIVHMVCIGYMADLLLTQVAFQRYLLEETMQVLVQRTGTLDKEVTASIVSTGAQNLRLEVRSTIEYLWSHEYRRLTHMLDEAEHDLIGSVIEDLWWAQSEEIALGCLFTEALDDHRRKHVLNLQKRRVEISQRLSKLRGRLDDTLRQCFVKRSIPA